MTEYIIDVIIDRQFLNNLKNINNYDENKIQTLKNVNGTFMWVDD